MMRAIVCSILFLLGSVSGAAGAQPEAAPPWARWEQRVRRMDLQPEQKDKVIKILDESRKERESIQALVRQAAVELNQLLEEPNVKEQAVLKQADKLGDLRTERQKAMLRALMKVRAELTPEQRQQLVGKAPMPANPPRRSPAPPATVAPTVSMPE